MWFWLLIIVLIIGVIVIVVGNHVDDYEISAVTFTFGVLCTIVSGLAVLIMLLFVIGSHTNIEAKLEKNREIYDALVYKMESTSCRDEFGFLSKEVIDEVQEWNEDVRFYQSAQDDFWVGIFYPNVYDEFETIDYESYNSNRSMEQEIEQ